MMTQMQLSVCTHKDAVTTAPEKRYMTIDPYVKFFMTYLMFMIVSVTLWHVMFMYVVPPNLRHSYANGVTHTAAPQSMNVTHPAIIIIDIVFVILSILSFVVMGYLTSIISTVTFRHEKSMSGVPPMDRHFNPPGVMFIVISHKKMVIHKAVAQFIFDKACFDLVLTQVKNSLFVTV